MANYNRILKLSDARKINGADTATLERHTRLAYFTFRKCASRFNENELIARKYNSEAAKGNLEKSGEGLLRLYGHTAYSLKVLSERYEAPGVSQNIKKAADCRVSMVFLREFMNEIGAERSDVSKILGKARELVEKSRQH